MESMGSRIKHRRLRGLVIHHRLHPSAHPRRLVRKGKELGGEAGRRRLSLVRRARLLDPAHLARILSRRLPGRLRPETGHAAHDVRGLRGSCRRARPQAGHQRRPGRWDRRRSDARSHSRTFSGYVNSATGARQGSIAALHAISGHVSLDWRGALRVWRLNRAWAGTFLPSLCSMDAGDDALTLRDVRTAA